MGEQGLGSQRTQHGQLGAEECGEVSCWGWLPQRRMLAAFIYSERNVKFIPGAGNRRVTRFDSHFGKSLLDTE